MKAKKGITYGELLILLVAAAVIVFGIVKYLPSNMEGEDITVTDSQQERDDEIERERERRLAREREEEARIKAEQERKRRLAKEKEERIKAEQEQKRRLAEEEAERAKKRAEQDAHRDAYRRIQKSFEEPFGFAKMAPDDENPQKIDSKKTFWYVFPSYSADRKIYEINAVSGGIVGGALLSPDGSSEPVEVAAFLTKMSQEAYAMTSGSGMVWVGNVRLPVGKYDVPSESFCIMADNFGELHEAAVMLGLKTPDARYNIYLQQKGSKKRLLVSTVAYNGSVSRAELENAARKALSEKARQAAANSKIKVKRRKFRQTVVLYDGTYIKKDLKGVTHVPRQFQFHGTNEGYARAYYDFQQKWQELYNEAVRQEREAQEVERENAAAMARAESEHSRKVSEAARSVDSDKVTDMLDKSNLIVEYIKKAKQ